MAAVAAETAVWAAAALMAATETAASSAAGAAAAATALPASTASTASTALASSAAPASSCAMPPNARSAPMKLSVMLWLPKTRASFLAISASFWRTTSSICGMSFLYETALGLSLPLVLPESTALYSLYASFLNRRCSVVTISSFKSSISSWSSSSSKSSRRRYIWSKLRMHGINDLLNPRRTVSWTRSIVYVVLTAYRCFLF